MDAYSAYWDNWFKLFKKHVKNHGTIYFLTEDKEPDFSFFEDVVHIKTGYGEWGARLLNGLSQIDSDLIFYMQEDFWAIKDITLEDNFLELFKNYKMDCLKICLNSELISISPIYSMTSVSLTAQKALVDIVLIIPVIKSVAK